MQGSFKKCCQGREEWEGANFGKKEGKGELQLQEHYKRVQVNFASGGIQVLKEREAPVCPSFEMQLRCDLEPCTVHVQYTSTDLTALMNLRNR